MFERVLGRVGVDDFNASFRGDVYGESGVDVDWFNEHVLRNGVDLARSPRWLVDGALAGMALLAFRGERAWVGAFGVVPALRGRGYGRRFVADTLALAAGAAARSVELEVLERNPAALALYQHCGFSPVGELVVWTRVPPVDAPSVAGEAARDYTAAEVARIARDPATSWQREPAGVAAAGPIEAVLMGDAAAPAAYAFVHHAAARTSLLDAGARDAPPATALLAALDARVPGAALSFLNEPPHGPLHDALAAHAGWTELARQRRMVARLG